MVHCGGGGHATDHDRFRPTFPPKCQMGGELGFNHPDESIWLSDNPEGEFPVDMVGTTVKSNS